MKDFEKSLILTQLYDIYHQLLTSKQRLYFEMYYFEDFSLTEIANLQNVSRNAVYDSLFKINVTLNRFETILNLHSKQEKRNFLYDNYLPQCKELIEKLKKIDN